MVVIVVNIYQVLWHLVCLSFLNHGHILSWVGEVQKPSESDELVMTSKRGVNKTI